MWFSTRCARSGEAEARTYDSDHRASGRRGRLARAGVVARAPALRRVWPPGAGDDDGRIEDTALMPVPAAAHTPERLGLGEQIAADMTPEPLAIAAANLRQRQRGDGARMQLMQRFAAMGDR